MALAEQVTRKHPLAKGDIMEKEFLASFLDKIADESDCLWWHGAKNDKGYGQLWIGDKKVYAHRFIYEYVNGPIPEKMQICHVCDNPSCVRLRHLFLGTRSDNIRDMHNKDRGGDTRSLGEQHGMSVLTEEKVLEIRRLYALGGVTYKELAYGYDVGWTTIQKIVTRASWKHI